ncbi:alpha/beta fold hydrolase [Antrihabitans sp. YC2-6]|uniref:alpha/beta fold hydrolase n=1 Tax=Antrihabitans sp. YC2-6 TaxID=2799498 RepID=UPI0018F448DC|nr:alpha/beta fold hydrolase [Antrihabitans sp. YC2-6]MBJ8348940.1 alpha/beta fold hydrolase [Antrihabitans sp. YC2-6]
MKQSRSVLAVIAAIAAAVVLSVTPTAHALPDTAPDPGVPLAGFYTPPNPLPPGQPGDVIKTEPMTVLLDPVLRVKLTDRAERIMYRSTDLHGNPIAITGTLVRPFAEWPGPGPQPLVSLAAGTQGAGDQCAPSHEMEAGTFYEWFAVTQLVARGWAVVVTDYRGLGTPGAHTMLNRVDSAHAVLDGARAGRQIIGPGPVGIAGYSQGGQAAAAAAELQPTYAPDLALVGAYAGAVPADLSKNGGRTEIATAGAEVGWLINGLIEAYPDRADAIRDLFNPAGITMLETTRRQCGFDTLIQYGSTETTEFTRDGRPIAAYLEQEPIASLLADQRVGNLTPTAPILLVHGSNDDSVPTSQTRQLAADWTAGGANVQFTEIDGPALIPGTGASHFLASLPSHADGAEFLAQQFASY